MKKKFLLLTVLTFLFISCENIKVYRNDKKESVEVLKQHLDQAMYALSEKFTLISSDYNEVLYNSNYDKTTKTSYKYYQYVGEYLVSNGEDTLKIISDDDFGFRCFDIPTYYDSLGVCHEGEAFQATIEYYIKDWYEEQPKEKIKYINKRMKKIFKDKEYYELLLNKNSKILYAKFIKEKKDTINDCLSDYGLDESDI